MAKLYFNTPLGTGLGALGSLGGGLAEGLYMGQDLSMRRKAMEQDEKRQQLWAAMQLLGLGAKAEDPAMVQAINAYLGRIDPNAPQIPAYDPVQAAQREAGKIYAQAQAIAGRAGITDPNSPEFKHIYNQIAGLKEQKRMVPVTGPDGKTYMVEEGKDLNAQLNVMKTQAYLQKLAQGGGRGGGGGGAGKISNYVNWHDAKGNIIGQGLFSGPRPPGAAYFTKVSTTDPRQVTEQPFSPADKIKLETARSNIKKAMESGAPPKEEDVIVLQAYGSVTGVDPISGQIKPPATGKQGKKKRAAVEPEAAEPAPAPPYEVPPPPAGFEED